MNDGLAVVLTALSTDHEASIAEATELTERSRRDLAALDDLLARARALTPHGDTVETVPLYRAQVTPPAPSGMEWEELREQSRARLTARGVDADIDTLLDPATVARIEQRFSGSFTLKAELDRYDVVAAIAAGIVAALVDFLLVRIPKDTLHRTTRDAFKDRGSPLTKWMQNHSLPHDNPLSDWCKTSFDRVSPASIGQRIEGFGPKTHRVMTLGHDPLLGLVFGTIDILRGGLTAIDRNGKLIQVSGITAGEKDVFVAFLREVAHLLSDAFTKMGVPAPGWTLSGFATFGSLTSDDLTVAQTARNMYLGGYDCRHFFTMATAPAAAEAVLRSYWCLRSACDGEFRSDTEHAGHVAGATSISAHPRHQAMSLLAHSIATAANAGKIAVFSNPLALNYAQWLTFSGALMRFAQTKLRGSGAVLSGHARANAEAIAQGWPDASDWVAEMPTLS